MQNFINKVNELSIEATEVVGDYSHSETIINPYLLTENIIKECCDIMIEEDSYYGEWMATTIKKHFGIVDVDVDVVSMNKRLEKFNEENKPKPLNLDIVYDI